jgi:hypothetical protein
LNDLDHYLDEVDSHLAFMSDADRRCLLNDLKAHVRELTTDERTADRFNGRYGIDHDQLIEELGDPGVIATDYLASVEKRPTLGMRVLLAVVSALAIALVLLGLDELRIARIAEGDTAAQAGVRGVVFLLSGFGVLLFSLTTQFKFDRLYFMPAFLVFAIPLIAIPITISLSHNLGMMLFGHGEVHVFTRFHLVFMAEFITLAVVGLYSSLKHYKVFQPSHVGLV